MHHPMSDEDAEIRMLTMALEATRGKIVEEAAAVKEAWCGLRTQEVMKEKVDAVVSAVAFFENALFALEEAKEKKEAKEVARLGRAFALDGGPASITFAHGQDDIVRPMTRAELEHVGKSLKTIADSMPDDSELVD